MQDMKISGIQFLSSSEPRSAYPVFDLFFQPEQYFSLTTIQPEQCFSAKFQTSERGLIANFTEPVLVDCVWLLQSIISLSYACKFMNESYILELILHEIQNMYV